MISTTYSPGWHARVQLGAGQQYAADTLRASIRHRSRMWHDAPRLRAFGRSPGTAHRLIHRLAALGVIALQTTLGRSGGVRFTFGVRRWRTAPIRRGASWRMRAPAVAGGQLAAWNLEDPGSPPEAPEPERRTIRPWRGPRPTGGDRFCSDPMGHRWDHVMTPAGMVCRVCEAGGRTPPEPTPIAPTGREAREESFTDKMRRHGFDIGKLGR